MNAHPEFTWVERPWGGCWLHQSRKVWIVEFDAVAPTFYQAFYVPGVPTNTAGNPPKGRDPWTVNNYRIPSRPHRGWPTFDKAVEACLNHLGKTR